MAYNAYIYVIFFTYINSANHECHSESEISTDFDEIKDGTICMANRDFVKGEQFTIYYGKRSNADLLVHNGFVYSSPTSNDTEASKNPKNHPNSMVLKIGIAKTDQFAQNKYDLLDQLSIPKSGGHFILSTEEKPFDNILLAFLRVLCMTTKEEFCYFCDTCIKSDAQHDDERNSGDKVRDLLNNTLSTHPELDAKVYKYLETRCNLLLRSYSTTLEEDLESLNIDEKAEGNPANQTLNRKHCILLRSQEKQILQHVIKYCRPIVDMPQST